MIKGYKIKPFADLRRADLAGADLSEADLSAADLAGANLRAADLSEADLRSANLAGANLRRANLAGADLSGANLALADLRGAYLGGLIIKQGPVRSDAYQYILFTSVLGGCVIRAGCRTWSGDDAFEQARYHCETVTSAKYRAEALRIIAFLEREFEAIKGGGNV